MSKPVYKINNWSVVFDSSPYSAPELSVRRLQGFKEGSTKAVTTSEIQDADGNLVRTRNSIYVLGQPDPEYLSWLSENNIKFNPISPIKIIR
jgi:hypothetical protein